MDFAVKIVATALPFVLVVLTFGLVMRWGRKRSHDVSTGKIEPWSRKRTMVVLGVLVVLTTVGYGWLYGWNLSTVLVVAGTFATGVALAMVDRFLDHRLHGVGAKVVGPMPYWWIFVWALALGWGSGMVESTEGFPAPVWVQLMVLAVLLIAAVAAFCLRYGLRIRR